MILSASRSDTTSLSSENKLPAMIAKEKLFFACKVDNFVNMGCNWPLMSLRTILFPSCQLK